VLAKRRITGLRCKIEKAMYDPGIHAKMKSTQLGQYTLSWHELQNLRWWVSTNRRTRCDLTLLSLEPKFASQCSSKSSECRLCSSQLAVLPLSLSSLSLLPTASCYSLSHGLLLLSLPRPPLTFSPHNPPDPRPRLVLLSVLLVPTPPSCAGR
jgi:hypothetical protein